MRTMNQSLFELYRVSDIHIEPFEKKVIVRFRKDGALREAMTLPKRMQNNITSRIKIMSKLDIAEKRKPQDGKFQMKIGNKAIDFRVSILPVVWGEKTVFRILDSSNLALDIKSLGFEPKRDGGLPVGLCAALRDDPRHRPDGLGQVDDALLGGEAHRRADINLVTVEDPVEYQLEGINQVPVNPKAGLTFAGALRSILRQDPDVVLLGEIRDHGDARDRRQGGAHGPPGAEHAAHQRRALDDHPHGRHGHGPVHGRQSTVVICAQRLARKLCVTARSRSAEEARRRGRRTGLVLAAARRAGGGKRESYDEVRFHGEGRGRQVGVGRPRRPEPGGRADRAPPEDPRARRGPPPRRQGPREAGEGELQEGRARDLHAPARDHAVVGHPRARVPRDPRRAGRVARFQALRARRRRRHPRRVRPVGGDVPLPEGLLAHLRSMVRAGEASGQLEILLAPRRVPRSDAHLRSEIKSAMTYPVISLCMVLGIAIVPDDRHRAVVQAGVRRRSSVRCRA
jgi:hypothetical protein